MKSFKFAVTVLNVPDDAYEADAKQYIIDAIKCHQGGVRPEDPMSGFDEDSRLNVLITRHKR